jgi:hypothetical protein
MEQTETEHSIDSIAPRYFATPPGKFVAMSICTLGVYEAYWTYKNWRIIKDRDGSKIMPFWRAVFYPLWHYSLLTELNETLESKALSSRAYRGFLAAAVLILNATWRLPDPYWLVSMLAFLAFLPALGKPKTTGAIQEQSSSFHISNLGAYLLGGPLVTFIALSSIGFFPSTAVVSGDRLWNRDISYLREKEILGPEEKIVYFYSSGLWSIAGDGQFFSEEYVTSYYQEPDTGRTYLDYVPFSKISNMDVAWAESFLDMTIVTITTTDNEQFEMWLSSEANGDRKFVDAMREILNRSQRQN